MLQRVCGIRLLSSTTLRGASDHVNTPIFPDCWIEAMVRNLSFCTYVVIQEYRIQECRPCTSKLCDIFFRFVFTLN